jgi:hypothetical protein
MVSVEHAAFVSKAPPVPAHRSEATSLALPLALLGLMAPPLGCIALLLGLRALRSRGPLGPHRGAALASVTLGGIATMTTIGIVVAIFLTAPDRPPRVALVTPAAAPPALVPDPSSASGTQSTLSLPVGHDITVDRAGELDLVRVGPAVRSLGEEIARQHDLANRRGDRTLLVVLASDCVPCNDVIDALPSAALQRALQGTRLVTVSAEQFAVELGRLGVPVDAFPGFALIGPEGRILDYVHGGEWDEDVPGNIAPVLESFVRGTYTARRDRWRGRHADETTL